MELARLAASRHWRPAQPCAART